MAPLRPSDQSLLDRLNALKPTNVSLDKTNNLPTDPDVVAAAAPMGQQLGPVAREDALTARLRILREKSASGADRESANVDLQSTQPQSEPLKTTSLNVSSSYPAVTRNRGVQDEHSDDPYLFETDDLDDILDGLDDCDLSHDLSTSGGGRNGGNEDERVSEILESLNPPGPDKLKSPQAGDDDDSESEQMTRSVERILAEVRDEISLEKEQSAEDATPDEASGITTTDPTATSNTTTANNNPTSLSLPGVPSSQLVDPALGQADHGTSGTAARKSLDFENDITTRLASLRGLGSGVNFDSFGLPTVPTFSPEDRSASTAASLITKRGGYTDEDQKTWCIVCLDDATIRCLSCDNDVYCQRCFKEMHFGPSAGYDERGHQWTKFQK
ncbi:hypothetical protein B0T14DRAFT_559506 [Immersiella caudata]|uniref:Abscission/NoCut checkpoint regulator n=1 Tax=Immersiella caudata TaxID=314043 RepID=A0AA39XD58_9PEZI|nr:hypothetical protein B0T14DRAFT_559506 [Immersiella caudata]